MSIFEVILIITISISVTLIIASSILVSSFKKEKKEEINSARNPSFIRLN